MSVAPRAEPMMLTVMASPAGVATHAVVSCWPKTAEGGTLIASTGWLKDSVPVGFVPLVSARVVL